jgi:hypothetical protein
MLVHNYPLSILNYPFRAEAARNWLLGVARGSTDQSRSDPQGGARLSVEPFSPGDVLTHLTVI